VEVVDFLKTSGKISKNGGQGTEGGTAGGAGGSGENFIGESGGRRSKCTVLFDAGSEFMENLVMVGGGIEVRGIYSDSKESRESDYFY